MKLGEFVWERKIGCNVIRAPGGWLYGAADSSQSPISAMSFVPFNNEFMEEVPAASVPSESKPESYPEPWIHATIHLNPITGEMHSDGNHEVRHWIKRKIDDVNNVCEPSSDVSGLFENMPVELERVEDMAGQPISIKYAPPKKPLMINCPPVCSKCHTCHKSEEPCPAPAKGPTESDILLKTLLKDSKNTVNKTFLDRNVTFLEYIESMIDSPDTPSAKKLSCIAGLITEWRMGKEHP